MYFSKKLKKFKNIKHCFFSRKNGFSKGYYKSLNCGLGSNDRKEDILKNLKFVSKKIGCNSEFLITLNQKHTNNVVDFKHIKSVKNKLTGDAMVTKISNLGIGILTADCAPVLLYDPINKIIGCIHSGWKGALRGIIKNTINKFREMDADVDNLIAVVGPCIKTENYEVKSDFYKKFINHHDGNKKFFIINSSGKYFFDLRGFVNKEIHNSNVKNIENIEIDTFSDQENFYSYRRSSAKGEKDYGRCISVILMT